VVNNYSEEFKKVAVQKVLSRGSRSIKGICLDLGISVPAIYKWKRIYATSVEMKRTERRPQDWTTVEKFKAVVEYDRLSEQEQGEFLRKEGLHSEHITAWKALMEAGLDAGGKTVSQSARAELSQLKAENKELKKDLNRKDRALAETTALLVLKKKADLIWGTGEKE
jgi:transposase-like protein